MRFEPFLG